MRKFLIIIAMSLPTTSIAKVCMLKEPTIVATQAQLTGQIGVVNAVHTLWTTTHNAIHALLESRIASITAIPAGCTFDHEMPPYVNGANGGAAWGVSKSGNSEADAKCTVTGIALCATNAGTYLAKGTPSGNNGQYCWCRMTTPRVGAWIFRSDSESSAHCAAICALSCVHYVRVDSTFRTAILAPL